MKMQHTMKALALPLSRRQVLRSGVAAFGALAVAGLTACGGGEQEPADDLQGIESTPSVPDPAPTAESEDTRTPDTPESPAPSILEATPTPSDATATPEPQIMTTAWRRIETAETPPPRRDHSLVADAEGRFAYLFGGVGNDGEINDLWVFDIGAETWSELTPNGTAPAPRFGHNASFDRTTGRLIIFGGQQGADFFSDVWAFDVADESWTQLGETGDGPTARYGAGGAADPESGTLYITHGFTTEGRFDDTWAYVTDTAEWSERTPDAGPRPEERCLARAVADPERDRLVLFGGQSDSAPYLNDLWSFDLDSNGWRQIDAIGPSPRNLYSAVRPDESPVMIIYGGRTDNGANGEIWILDLVDDTWSAPMIEGSVPMPRLSHDATWLTERRSMLVFGGQSSDTLNDTWELTLDAEMLPSED